MRTWLIIAAISLAGVLAVEGLAWLIVGSAPHDSRYTCTAEASPNHFKIFSYGGSTVYGGSIPEYGFMAQLNAALQRSEADTYTVCNIGQSARDSSGVLLDIERTISYSPDLIIVLSGHNEFLATKFESTVMRRWRERVSRLAAIRLFNAVMRRLVGGLVSRADMREPVHYYDEAVQARDRTSPDFQARVIRYQKNLAKIVEHSRGAGVPLVVGTLPANIYDWAPVYNELSVAQGGVRNPQAVAQVLDALNREDYAIAKQRMDSINWEEDESDTPIFRYLHAKIKAGQADQLSEQLMGEFQAAFDLDPVPWRARTGFNEYVREMARSSANTTLVDVDHLFRAAASHQLPGFDLISDNCHPNPTGNYLIARALLDVIEFQRDTTIAWSEQDADTYLKSYGDGLLLEYYLRNGRYVMKTPFFNYALSRTYLEQAANLDASDWRIWANLASLALLEGKTDEGLILLRKAVAMQPDKSLLVSRGHAPYLEKSLDAAEIDLEALLSNTPHIP